MEVREWKKRKSAWDSVFFVSLTGLLRLPTHVSDRTVDLNKNRIFCANFSQIIFIDAFAKSVGAFARNFKLIFVRRDRHRNRRSFAGPRPRRSDGLLHFCWTLEQFHLIRANVRIRRKNEFRKIRRIFGRKLRKNERKNWKKFCQRQKIFHR